MTTDMTRDLVLAIACLVLPDEVLRGAIVVRHGVIAQISTGTRVPKGAIDCRGATLSPGLI